MFPVYIRHSAAACSESLKTFFYSSASQKRPPSAAVSLHSPSGSAPVSSPCHLPFASENQQGNASNHLSCKHAARCISSLLHKATLSECHAKQATSHAAHLAFLRTSTLQSFHQNDVLFVPLPAPFPRLPLCSSPVNALKRFLGTLLSETCKYFFLFLKRSPLVSF